MKGGLFIDLVVAPTIGGTLSTLFGSTAYGHYPDIQALWDQYLKAADLKSRKDLIIRVQKLIHDKMEFIPLTSTNSPAAFSTKVKGNPYKIQPLIWFISPFEDVELAQ